MKFSTLLIFTTAVLAMPALETSDDDHALSKRIMWRPYYKSRPSEVRHSKQESENSNFFFPDDIEAVKERIRAARRKAAEENARKIPDKETPDKETPDRVTPDRVTPDKETPEKVTPDRVTPKTMQKDPNKKWKYSNSGQLCNDFWIKPLEQVPEECIKSVACSGFVFNKMECGLFGVFFKTVNKQQLIEVAGTMDCAQEVICTEEDFKAPELE